MSRLGCGLTMTLSLLLSSMTVAADKDYGTLTGQFVFEGDVPAPKVMIAKGGKVKDPQVCAAKDMLDNTLLVDRKSKGIANIAIYLKEKPKKIHPSLKASKVKEVVCDQEHCRFIPHIMLVRTDQTIVVKSKDPVNHNTHTYPFFNEEKNFTIGPKDRVGTKLFYDQPEISPVKVVCDLHPHMKTYWVLVDHPYATITDKDGKFTIEKIPDGTYIFRCWHERCGFLFGKDGLTVDIFGGEVTDLEQNGVTPEKLKLK